jgi:hypothetical protein
MSRNKLDRYGKTVSSKCRIQSKYSNKWRCRGKDNNRQNDMETDRPEWECNRYDVYKNLYRKWG